MFSLSRLVAIVATSFVITTASAQAQDDAMGHLRLIDRLDRPQDGYCLDILGTGQTLRLEVPVFAHNCKPGLTTDSALEITDAGEIRFVAVDLCVTAFGVNGRSLPSSPIILRPCGHNAPYFESAALQGFEWTVDNRLKLKNTSLCLSVGDVSDTTYSLADSWRALTVETCASMPSERAAWEFVRLN